MTKVVKLFSGHVYKAVKEFLPKRFYHFEVWKWRGFMFKQRLFYSLNICDIAYIWWLWSDKAFMIPPTSSVMFTNPFFLEFHEVFTGKLFTKIVNFQQNNEQFYDFSVRLLFIYVKRINLSS